MYLSDFKFRVWNDSEQEYDYHKKILKTQFSRYTKYAEIELYIGITDKNNKEIYVGDIIRFNNKNYLVSLENIFVGLMIGDKEIFYFSNKDADNFEVIGNHKEHQDIKYQGL